jgi:hypothetical protein
MSPFFQRLLHQLLRELGMAVSSPAAPTAGAAPQARQIAELGAWIQTNIVARARDLFARIKVAGGARPSAYNAPVAPPDIASAPTSTIAPPSSTTPGTLVGEPPPASTIVAFGDSESSEDDAWWEPRASEQNPRGATHGCGSTSRPALRREQPPERMARRERAGIVNEAA